jgi:hypothetical protein
MTLLSALLAAESNPSTVYGVTVDIDDVTPPEGVTEIGLISALPDGSLEETVLDVAISYILAGMSVTIELAAETEIADPKHLVSTAASIGASLSFLPPADGSDNVAASAYIDRVEIFARAYAKQANFAKLLIPVTSYLQYLFVEVLDPDLAAEFKPTDSYLTDRFVSAMSPARVDEMKERIKLVFHEAFGGPEGFKELGGTLFHAIFERVEEGFKDQIKEVAREASQPSV